MTKKYIDAEKILYTHIVDRIYKLDHDILEDVRNGPDYNLRCAASSHIRSKVNRDMNRVAFPNKYKV